jgi:glucosyl-3-phosphoglycerate synthase
VTEILVRPLFSLFYPELAYLVQPLSGEYAGRRALLESLPFSVGYGVEIGHLVDILRTRGVGCIGQVDLDRRVHRNQPVQALSRMAFGIMSTFFSRLVKYGDADNIRRLHSAHVALSVIGSRHETVFSEIPVHERPPMAEIEEYVKRRA